MEVAGLLAALEASARAEAGALVRAAESRAAAMAAEGARRRELERARAQGEADAALAAALEEAVRSARHQAAAGELLARRRFLDEVYRRAEALLPEAIACDAYAAQLPARLDEALAYAGDGTATIRCAPALLERLQQLAGDRARVEAEPGIPDGFEVIARAGALRIDARLSTDLQRLWPEIAIGVGKVA